MLFIHLCYLLHLFYVLCGRYFLNFCCGFKIQNLCQGFSVFWMVFFNLSDLTPGLLILDWGLNALLTWVIILERTHRFFVEVCSSWLNIYLIMDGQATSSPGWAYVQHHAHWFPLILGSRCHVCLGLRIHPSSFYDYFFETCACILNVSVVGGIYKWVEILHEEKVKRIEELI